MHDQIIAQDIIQEAERHGSVRAITLEVGELAPLPSADIKKTLNAWVGWEIRIKEIPAEVKCPCGYIGSPEVMERQHEHILFQCPKCGNLPRVQKGGSIRLVEVIVD